MSEIIQFNDVGQYPFDESITGGVESLLFFDLIDSFDLVDVRLNVNWVVNSGGVELTFLHSFDNISYTTFKVLKVLSIGSIPLTIDVVENAGLHNKLYIKISCNEVSPASNCTLENINIVLREEVTGLVLHQSYLTYGIADKVEIRSKTNSGIAIPVDNTLTFDIENGDVVDVGCEVNYDLTTTIDVPTSIVFDDSLDNIGAVNKLQSEGIFPVDNITHLIKLDDLHSVDTSTLLPYTGILPYVDVHNRTYHRGVHLLSEKPIPPSDFRYLPTSDFEITDEEIGFTSDFINPIDYDKLVTPLSPVGGGGSFNWGRPKIVDIERSLTYGYSINEFLIGGSTDTNYPVDEDAVYVPEPPPETGEVVTFVNIINVVVLPSRTAIAFTNFTLSVDLDSVAWIANFDISDQASLDLIKPQGSVVKEVEININGELFNVFIGKTSTSLSSDRKKGIQRSIKCTGWSSVKQLSYPYHKKRSHTETSSSTPSGILNGELTGTGFTATWSSPSWTLPAHVFSYIDKAPLAAISDLVKSVGGVIIPHPTDKSFIVKPRYPISTWNWAAATVDKSLSEAQFFSMDTEWLPAESPDSIYVYGEEGGVGVKCVKQGTAGLITLPTVVDKHITDTIAGTERGRIEVCVNGFKEIIPITTYLDGTGIIMPHTLLEVTALDGSTWRGMVVGVSLSIKRVGNAVIQALSVERHYD